MDLQWVQTNDHCWYANVSRLVTYWIQLEADSYRLEYEHFELEYPENLGKFRSLQEAKDYAEVHNAT